MAVLESYKVHGHLLLSMVQSPQAALLLTLSCVDTHIVGKLQQSCSYKLDGSSAILAPSSLGTAPEEQLLRKGSHSHPISCTSSMIPLPTVRLGATMGRTATMHQTPSPRKDRWERTGEQHPSPFWCVMPSRSGIPATRQSATQAPIIS